jgi:L-ascorbate metabolism protein UlaG (beta-lactamase superfamily)
MDITRLGWAGLEIASGDHRIAVDLLEGIGPMEAFVGPPKEPLPAPSGPLDAALVTHLHGDHTDPDALARALKPGAAVLRPEPHPGSGLDAAGTVLAEQGLAEHGLATDVLGVWEQRTVGPFTVTAVPAVDGFGDPQVSWVVEADGTRILHAGDTLFHGAWWAIVQRCGPIDVAFLPVNAAVCDFPHKQPASPLPATLGPREAAAAAHLLGVRLAVPIHYGAISGPPVYAPRDDAADAFVREADALGVTTLVVEPGAPVRAPVAT